ncbi:MAG: hypothetical protein A3H98_00620 [Bacteroidetes bacterium RIFCSPLOWO2_02_FULL_36_8]|nr:MAG: hypothetical protein A3H98_00620 [Bacteroidetes bacterium RIFCSPLOWO2_02_FULL_36_8]OFY69424.1 MAG: hypothetical protein A3G23_00690 [Bacteroidetes bacterium RIFCSPLOWO2_12_FULL_37_12]
MIKTFKSDYPIVIFFTLLALIVFRTPLWISEVPVLQLELKWLVIGEKLSEGGFLYKDLLTTLEPLSAGVYWLLNLISGRTVLSLRIIATILVLVQALLISIIIRKRKSFEKVGYLPSLIYVLLTSVSWEFNTLSPQLMGSTFLIISLNFIFNMPSEKNADYQIFYSGLCVGVATLFYFPYITFLALVWFSMALYRSDNLRELLLVVVGFICPVACISLYYFFNGCFLDFISFFSPADVPQNYSFKPSYQLIIFILGIPLLFFLILFNYLRRNFYNSTMHVKNCRQIFLFWIFVSLISLLWIRKIYLIDFFILFVPFSVLIAFGLSIFRNYWKAEGLFVILFLSIIAINVLMLHSSFVKSYAKSNDYIISYSPLPETMYGKKIMVLSDNVLFYLHNRLATPYFDWSLINRDFSKLNNYQTIYVIYQRIMSDMPELVVDENNLFESFLVKAPLIDGYFVKIPGTVIYRRINFLHNQKKQKRKFQHKDTKKH